MATAYEASTPDWLGYGSEQILPWRGQTRDPGALMRCRISNTSDERWSTADDLAWGLTAAPNTRRSAVEEALPEHLGVIVYTNTDVGPERLAAVSRGLAITEPVGKSARPSTIKF